MTTNFKLDGVDLDNPIYLTKSYLMDVYPNLVPWMRTTGLWVCGYNTLGAIGDNTTTNRSSPVQTIAGGTNWKQAACGQYHTAAIKTDGTLWTWGRDNYGQLGDNTTISKSSPVQVISGGTNWQQVACGNNLISAIKTDGTLWLWGADTYGQLGDNTTISKSSPVQTITGGTNWKQSANGTQHSAAIKTDGTLWTWGYNAYGNLGDNTASHKSSPVQTVAGGTNWKQLSCGFSHTAAIKIDGTLWIWGYNNYGQLGNNAVTHKSSPVQTVAGGTNWKQVSTNYWGTVSIKTDGTLWIWGSNGNGVLGDNTLIDKSSPVQTITGGTNWKQIAGGSYFNAAIKTDGTLWTWGKNLNGQLGDNTSLPKSSPIQTVTGGTNWKSVACGYWNMMAIRDVDS